MHDLPPTDTTLAMTRRIPAPPDAVFAAWTDPARVREWWGPRGMTTPACEIELRPGGLFRAPMREASGQEHPCDLRIEAVEAPHRLEFRIEDAAGGKLAGARATIGFLPEGDGTRLEVVWRHPTAEMRDAHAAMGFEQGWGSMVDKLTAHMVRPMEGCPFATGASVEHGWLQRLLGDWTYESVAMAPPGHAEPMRASGTERVRSLGGYWVVGEGEGTMPGGGASMRWIITMGYDARTGRFSGTWVGSMMGHMCVYDGALSEDGRTLTLECDAPAFSGEGLARYRDVVELDGDDRRRLVSYAKGEDGGWAEFMRAEFRRA